MSRGNQIWVVKIGTTIISSAFSFSILEITLELIPSGRNGRNGALAQKLPENI